MLAAVTDNASDQGQLVPMVDTVAQTCGETPEQVLADASYCYEPNLQALPVGWMKEVMGFRRFSLPGPAEG